MTHIQANPIDSTLDWIRLAFGYFDSFVTRFDVLLATVINFFVSYTIFLGSRRRFGGQGLW